jgi:hypothetical protein
MTRVSAIWPVAVDREKASKIEYAGEGAGFEETGCWSLGRPSIAIRRKTCYAGSDY